MLALVLDLLKEGVDVDIAELVMTLDMDALRLLKREWSYLRQDWILVYLTESTNTLASIFHALPYTLPSSLRRGILRQLFLLMEVELPKKTLKILVNCTCHILAHA